MVIPWLGFPLARAAQARGAHRRRRSTWPSPRCWIPSRCPASSAPVLDWPYVEGLRLDEAMHPLDAAGGGAVRQGAAQPERRAAAAGGAVEVRLQGHQVDREDHASREQQPPTTWNLAAPRRVRLLRQREPRRWITRAGARPPSAASASSAAARRCPSTATPSRWPASTPAWTCARTSEIPWPPPPLPWLKPARPRRRRSLRWRCWRSRARRARWAPTPSRPCSTRLGLLALIFLVALAGVHAAEAGVRVDVADRASASCSGCWRFTYAALHFLTYAVVDQGLDARRHPRGHHEAAVHHRGLPRAGAAGAAGRDLDERVRAALGFPAGSGCTGWPTWPRCWA